MTQEFFKPIFFTETRTNAEEQRYSAILGSYIPYVTVIGENPRQGLYYCHCADEYFREITEQDEVTLDALNAIYEAEPEQQIPLWESIAKSGYLPPLLQYDLTTAQFFDFPTHQSILLPSQMHGRAFIVTDNPATVTLAEYCYPQEIFKEGIALEGKEKIRLDVRSLPHNLSLVSLDVYKDAQFIIVGQYVCRTHDYPKMGRPEVSEIPENLPIVSSVTDLFIEMRDSSR